jgi:hypothetical protein
LDVTTEACGGSVASEAKLLLAASVSTHEQDLTESLATLQLTAGAQFMFERGTIRVADDGEARRQRAKLLDENRQLKGELREQANAAQASDAVSRNYSSRDMCEASGLRALIASCPTPSRRGRCPTPPVGQSPSDRGPGGLSAKSPQHCPRHERGTPRRINARMAAEACVAAHSCS